MCLTCCPTVLPLTSDVTRRLLSQWPPLNSSLPSWETTKRLAVTSTPGAKGPDRKRWVLELGSSGMGEESYKKLQDTEGNLRLCCWSYFALETVGSLMKVK